MHWRWLYLVSAVVQERLQTGIGVEFAQSDAQGAIGGDGAVKPVLEGCLASGITHIGGDRA